MNKSPFIISIDGNIGSGKSTLFNNLKTLLKGVKNIGFVPEPVEQWNEIVDKNNVPILTNLYSNIQKFAFRFQMMAYISRISLLREMCNKGIYDVLITERSVYTDRNLFCKMLYDDGIIEHDEYTIYNKWFHEFTDNLNLSHIIYVNADPEICFQRILKRNREGEIVDIDYLERLHIYHEKWLNKCEYPVHTILGNYDTSQKQYATKETEWTKECSDIINKLLETSKENKNSLLYTLYFAGYCDSIKKSKNKGATSYIICNNNNEKITVSSKIIENENISNNLLEYYALIDALEYTISNNINNIIIKSNSLVVIKQLLGKYKIKNDMIRQLHGEAIVLLGKIDKYKLQHVIDTSNREAITVAKNTYNQSCKLPKLFCSRSEPKI